MLLQYLDVQLCGVKLNSLGLCLGPKFQNIEGKLFNRDSKFPNNCGDGTYFSLLVCFFSKKLPENLDFHFLLELHTTCTIPFAQKVSVLCKL